MDPLDQFLQTPFGKTATHEEIERLKTREPLSSRKPSVALYHGLLALYRSSSTPLPVLLKAIEASEAIDQEIATARAARRPKLSLVEP